MQLFARRAKAAQYKDSITVDIAGAPVAIAVRVHPRACSYRLRLGDTGPVLTVPPHGNCEEASAFVARHRTWLEVRLERLPGPRPFVEGALVPLRGIDHRIVATGRLRGTVTVAGEAGMPVLRVPGAPEHLGRRLTDWLKRQAERDLGERVAFHAANLGVRPAGLTIRSPSSRWGSCSSAKRLNFNWRLVLAPPFVLDYVAAHEVAHIGEMNHSPAFWAAVESTLPDYKRGRVWLRAHGRELMVQGREAG
jgi:predicted metal-dependent hydrolase